MPKSITLLSRGLRFADNALRTIDEYGIRLVDVDRLFALEAARIKAIKGLGYADCFAAALASRLGVASRNAYARYERGDAVPTVEKLDELIKATAPGGDFVIRESEADR